MLSKRLKLSFSIFLAFMPIVGIYASPIPGLNLAEIILAIFWLLFLKDRHGILSFSGKADLCLFVVYNIVIYIVNCLAKGIGTDIFFRTVRFSFYYLTAAFWGQLYFDLNTYYKWLRRIVVLSVAFIIFQYFAFYISGRSILGFIPGLKVFQDYRSETIISKFAYAYRPSSFFQEPAHYCQYLFIFLIFTMFNSQSKNRIVDLIICCVGIILSTSGQGILIGAGIWLIYIVSMFRKQKLNTNRFIISILFIFSVPIIMYVLSRATVVSTTISRITNTGEQSASYARLGVYSYFLSDSSILEIVFGHSFGAVISESLFMPDVVYIIYGSGLIGMFILLVFFYKNYFRGNVVNRILIITFLVLFSVASTFRSLTGLVYLILLSDLTMDTLIENNNEASKVM